MMAAAILITHALWACYAVRQQIRLYGRSRWRVPLVALLNFTLCPLCIAVAIMRNE